MITLKNYLSASGRYPERVNSAELTAEILENAENLLERVNAVLTELGITSVSISSGFRPASVNAITPGAAKKSLHTQCLAIDIIDDKAQSLGKALLAHPNLLRSNGLWLENLMSTVGKKSTWVHIDLGTRKDRASRTFMP